MKITLIGTGCGTTATLTEQGRAALQKADVIFGAARVLEGLKDFFTSQHSPPSINAEGESLFSRHCGSSEYNSPSENAEGAAADRNTGCIEDTESVRLRPKHVVEAKPKQICNRLAEYFEAGNISNAAIALSGDSGFYSGARILKKRISERFTAEHGYNIELEILPGISSVQVFAAKLGVPWQNWNLVSAHGVDCDVVHEIMKGRETFFLTGGRYTVGVICRELAEAGLGDLRVTVGENLTYITSSSAPNPSKKSSGSEVLSSLDSPEESSESEALSSPNSPEEPSESEALSSPNSPEEPSESPRSERILTGTALDFADKSFDDLAVMLVDTKTLDEETLIVPPRPFGIPDSEFIRGKVPMTKMEVRCVILGKMGISDNDVVWDIGAGTGSVSVELAMRARQVWALERKDEAVELIKENRKKFGRWNLHIVQGNAPEDMDQLPAPDAVFVGGSGGRLGDILQRVWERNEEARICISATLLETINEGLEVFAQRGIEPDIAQVAVSRAETIGGKHMMKAGNPIFILVTQGGPPVPASK